MRLMEKLIARAFTISYSALTDTGSKVRLDIQSFREREFIADRQCQDLFLFQDSFAAGTIRPRTAAR